MPKTNKTPLKVNLVKKSVKTTVVPVVPVEEVMTEVVATNRRGQLIMLPM